MKSVPIVAIDRHTFRELAKMTKNRKLRKVYARLMAKYWREDIKNAL